MPVVYPVYRLWMPIIYPALFSLLLYMHVTVLHTCRGGGWGSYSVLSLIKPDEVGHDVVAGENSLVCQVEPSVVDSHLS